MTADVKSTLTQSTLALAAQMLAQGEIKEKGIIAPEPLIKSPS